nr:1512_t:CDS:2 [Entrophospora candida]
MTLQEPQSNSESNNSSPTISQQPDSKQNSIAVGDIATQDIGTELKQQNADDDSLQASFDHLNNANQNFNRCVNLNLNDANLNDANPNDTNPNIIKPPYNTIWFYNRDEPYYEFTNFKENFPIKAALVPRPGSAPEVKSWPTSEHLFQAAKFQNTRREICDLIRKCYKPRDAFNMARRYQQFTDPNWHEINVNVMEWVVKKKFEQHPILAKRLLETGDKILVEHTELDRFWGDGGDGTGSNMLGIILMNVRKELRDSNYLEKLEKSRRKSVEGVTTTNNEMYSSHSETSSTNSLSINNSNDGDDDSPNNINPIQQQLHQQQIQQQIQQELDQQAQLLQQLQLQPQIITPTPTPPPQLLMTGDGLIIDQSLTMQNSPAAFYYGYPSSPTPPPSNPQNHPPYNPYS